MATALTDALKKLLDEKSFVTLATVQPDGSPQTSVIWVLRDGDDVLFSTTTQRRKYQNMVRDPRVSLSLFDPARPYLHAEIRGTAAVTPDEGFELRDRLSRKYLGTDYPDDTPRVAVRVTPRKVLDRLTPR